VFSLTGAGRLRGGERRTRCGPRDLVLGTLRGASDSAGGGARDSRRRERRLRELLAGAVKRGLRLRGDGAVPGLVWRALVGQLRDARLGDGSGQRAGAGDVLAGEVAGELFRRVGCGVRCIVGRGLGGARCDGRHVLAEGLRYARGKVGRGGLCSFAKRVLDRSERLCYCSKLYQHVRTGLHSEMGTSSKEAYVYVLGSRRHAGRGECAGNLVAGSLYGLFGDDRSSASRRRVRGWLVE
jgi:hypothetical protein